MQIVMGTNIKIKSSEKENPFDFSPSYHGKTVPLQEFANS